jgi:cytochrome c oxidase subunit 2
VLLITVLTLVLTGCSGPLSMLDPAGPSARSVAILWWGMFAYATLVFIALAVLWLIALKRPQDSRPEAQQQRVHQRWIIGGGVLLPSISILLLLIVGVPMGHRILPLPPAQGEALRIEVTGHQWWWEVRYPDAAITLTNELHIPAGTPIDIHLATADVIHAFWVPRLGGKLDAIPGRINVLRLQADEPGVYLGQCAEFCGLHHARMSFTVTAHSPRDFTRWLEAQTQ